MEKRDLKLKIWYEVRDLLAGAAFPLMLMLILSVAFISLIVGLTDEFVLRLVLLIVGEALVAAALVIFGRQNGVTSVRKLVQHAKKRDLGTKDKRALFGTGEYGAYKGFLIGFISCIPYIILQIIHSAAPNGFCYVVLNYGFSWAVYPFAELAAGSQFKGSEQWLNLVMVLFPVIVHGAAYIWGAHAEWSKQQKVAELQSAGNSAKKQSEEPTDE